MISISDCTECGAMIPDSASWTHQMFHDAQRSAFPCALCGANVPSNQVSLHLDHHARMDRVEQLLHRLLGDVEAHLEYLGQENQVPGR